MLQKLGSITLVLTLFMPLRQSGAQENETALSARLANYEMDVKLDAQKRLINGTEILTWKNSTSHSTSQTAISFVLQCLAERGEFTISFNTAAAQF